MTKEERKVMRIALEDIKDLMDCCDDIPKWRLDELKTSITAIDKCLINDSLEKKAENARELGLDYEPVATNDTSQERVDETAKQRHEPVAYDKTELNCFAQDLYDQKMREGKRGHYESMFHVIHQCIKKVAPPPRQPLTSKQIREWWASENGFEDCNMARLDDFEQVVRAVEGKHGITGEKA